MCRIQFNATGAKKFTCITVDRHKQKDHIIPSISQIHAADPVIFRFRQAINQILIPGKPFCAQFHIPSTMQTKIVFSCQYHIAAK